MALGVLIFGIDNLFWTLKPYYEKAILNEDIEITSYMKGK